MDNNKILIELVKLIVIKYSQHSADYNHVSILDITDSQQYKDAIKAVESMGISLDEEILLDSIFSSGN